MKREESVTDRKAGRGDVTCRAHGRCYIDIRPSIMAAARAIVLCEVSVRLWAEDA